MGKLKAFRDPIHHQITYKRVDLSGVRPEDCFGGLGWLVQQLIDSLAFQRLRHIRQNGLANLVFHGLEHSRFSHSMGVAHLARRMYLKIARRGNLPISEREFWATTCAALLHDVGHGPFSHTLEEILGENDVEFDHEVMTVRFIMEETEVRDILASVDGDFPKDVAKYIDKVIRGEDKHWSYKLVSSQLDADRLDYVQRDAFHAGLVGHGFDMPRLLDSLMPLVDRQLVAVDRGGVEALESYLLLLDQLYRAIYYHHAVRCAGSLLASVIRRAVACDAIDPDSPLGKVFDNGQDVDLVAYLTLTEGEVWTDIRRWARSRDEILSDLSRRLLCRQLPKSVDLLQDAPLKSHEIIKKAEQLAKDKMGLSDEQIEYRLDQDSPTRVSYRHKLYDWENPHPDESIVLADDGGLNPELLEDEDVSGLIAGLKQQRRFSRIILPAEIRGDVEQFKETL